MSETIRTIQGRAKNVDVDVPSFFRAEAVEGMKSEAAKRNMTLDESTVRYVGDVSPPPGAEATMNNVAWFSFEAEAN